MVKRTKDERGSHVTLDVSNADSCMKKKVPRPARAVAHPRHDEISKILLPSLSTRSMKRIPKTKFTIVMMMADRLESMPVLAAPNIRAAKNRMQLFPENC